MAKVRVIASPASPARKPARLVTSLSCSTPRRSCRHRTLAPLSFRARRTAGGRSPNRRVVAGSRALRRRKRLQPNLCYPRSEERGRPSTWGTIVKITREDVLRVADLAYLDLTDAELQTYRAQIDEILEYVGKLNELDTANVEPMAQVLADEQTADATLREDLVVLCAVADDVLQHAPDPEPPYFRVPKVIERS